MSARRNTGVATHATHIEHPEVVDRDHAAVETLSHLEALVSYGSEDAGTEAVPRAVRDLDSFLHRFILYDQSDGCKDWKNGKSFLHPVQLRSHLRSD